MNKKPHTKLVQAGDYVAQVEVELIHAQEGWTPYLSLEDAQKLDAVREALKMDDIKTARQHARVYRLTPVEA